MAAMRIDNQTEWNTDDLRSLFAAGLDKNRKHEGPFQSSRLRIKVVYSRRHDRYSGHAWLNTGHIRIRLPKPEYDLNVRMTAAIFDHELQHCRGYRHEHGLCPHISEAGLEACAWADAFTISIKTPKEPMPREHVLAAKMQHALDRAKAALTKKKRAETIHKRWQRRVKYYERAITAAAAKSKP